MVKINDVTNAVTAQMLLRPASAPALFQARIGNALLGFLHQVIPIGRKMRCVLMHAGGPDYFQPIRFGRHAETEKRPNVAMGTVA